MRSYILQVCKYGKESIKGKLPALSRNISTLHSTDLASLAPKQHLADAVKAFRSSIVPCRSLLSAILYRYRLLMLSWNLQPKQPISRYGHRMTHFEVYDY